MKILQYITPVTPYFQNRNSLYTWKVLKKYVDNKSKIINIQNK